MPWGAVTQLSSRYLLPFARCNPTTPSKPTPLCSADDTLSVTGTLGNNVASDTFTKPLLRLPSPSPSPSSSPSPSLPTQVSQTTTQSYPRPKSSRVTIHNLPNELFLIITGDLTTFRDLLHLAQATRHLNTAITPILHSRAVTHYSLIWAARRGYESLVRILLDNGVPVESRLNPYGKTAIHYAACEGRESIVKLLLDRGANVNSQGAAKQTALHLAALNGYEGIVRVLLDRGADVTIRDSTGHTALLLTVRYSGSKKVDAIARLLLEGGKGCYGYIDAQESDSVMHWAAVKGREETVQLLLEY